MKLHLTTSKDLGLANVRKIKTCKKKPKTNEIGIYDLIHHADEPDLFHLIQELSYNYFQTFIWGGLIILIFVCVKYNVKFHQYAIYWWTIDRGALWHSWHIYGVLGCYWQHWGWGNIWLWRAIDNNIARDFIIVNKILALL